MSKLTPERLAEIRAAMAEQDYDPDSPVIYDHMTWDRSGLGPATIASLLAHIDTLEAERAEMKAKRAAPLYACGDLGPRLVGQKAPVRCKVPENEPHAIHRADNPSPIRDEITWWYFRPDDEEGQP